MAAINQDSCGRVFKHAHLRRTFKGVAEVVKINIEENKEEQMQLEWLISFISLI